MCLCNAADWEWESGLNVSVILHGLYRPDCEAWKFASTNYEIRCFQNRNKTDKQAKVPNNFTD